MTIYGQTSRVSVDLQGGGIAGVSLAAVEKLVLFARGDPAAGSASAETPTRVSGPSELEDTFGSDVPLVDYFKQAASNGMSYDEMWGVMPTQTQVQDEDITGGGDAADHTGGDEIANAPIVEDASLITIEDDQSNSIDVEFRYETNKDDTSTDFTSLSPGADTIFINPVTGEWVADAADNYNITYEYLDWSAAFTAAEGAATIEEQELGVWGVGTESSSVMNSAQSTVNPLRTDEWKMIRVVGLARPNQTGSDDGAEINAGNYTDTVDADAVFLAGPARLDGSVRTVLGAVAGTMASVDYDESIYGNLSGVGSLEQTLSVPDQETLEGEQVIPLSNLDTPAIEGNLGTSTETDWTRSHFARHLSDQLILAARAVAKAARGKLNNDNVASMVENQIGDEIVDFIDQGVLEPNEPDNPDEDTKWYVSADEDSSNPRELDVSFGFTPTGVVDIVDVGATINF